MSHKYLYSMYYIMENILSYIDFINENHPKKIIINGETNEIDIDGEKYEDSANNDIFDEISSAVILKNIKSYTGGYKGGDFENVIKDNAELIRSMENRSMENKLKYPEVKGKDIYFHKFPNEYINDLRTLFKLKPKKNGTIGSGEVLFAVYYDNVIRTKLKSLGGESGDCEYEENGKKKYIEIKVADSPFKTLSNYRKLFKSVNEAIKKDYTDENKLREIDNIEYLGGIAAYIYRQKKNEYLDFVLFDGEVRKPDSMTGYLTIKRSPNESIKTIIKKLQTLKIEPNGTPDTRGGELSRDFTISYENEVLIIHPKKKE